MLLLFSISSNKNMKQLIIVLVCCHNFDVCAQTCNTTIDFGSNTTFPVTYFSGTTDIVQNVSGNASSTQSFDLWNDNGSNTTSYATPGNNYDITIEFTSNSGVNPCTGGSVQNSLTLTASDITQGSTGFKSSINFESLSSSAYSVYPGDTRCQIIEVTFASHVDIAASDFDTQYYSGNSTAKIFESIGIIFLGTGGTPYGTITYNDYYGSGSNPSVTTCGTAVSPGTPYSTSSSGVFIAASTSSVSASLNNCIAVSDTSGPNNSNTINDQNDAGLNAIDKIIGVRWIHRMENIQGAISVSTASSPLTKPSANLNGFTIGSLLLPIL